MAQSVGLLPGVMNSGVNLSVSCGGGRSSLYGDPVPLAIPSTRPRYSGEQARSPPGAPWAYVTDASDGDHFVTLGVSRGASKREIKSAYKRLALKYHPDVCKGDACTRSFVHITAAYERAMQGLPALSDDDGSGSADEYVEGCMGVGDETWEDWEEWMGWEGAGTRDYSSHVNIHV